MTQRHQVQRDRLLVQIVGAVSLTLRMRASCETAASGKGYNEDPTPLRGVPRHRSSAASLRVGSDPSGGRIRGHPVWMKVDGRCYDSATVGPQFSAEIRRKVMKAGILYGDKDIRLGQTADPETGPDQVLVAPTHAGICGTDVHIYRGEFHERVKFPAIQGHEFGGFVEEVGREVRGVKRGDRVAVDPIISCHRCPACLTGRPNACRTLKLLGVDIDGGYGQYVAVPSDRIFPLPDQIPLEHVPMVEMYGLGHHILQRGEVQPGETVALLGAGRLGLSVLDVLCHSASPGLTIVTDIHDFRLETAKKLGADVLVNARKEDPVGRVLEVTGGVGVDCVIECIGHYHEVDGQEAPLGQAVRMVRSAGRVVTAGLGEQPSPVHFKTLVLKEAQFIGSRVTLGEFPRAMRMMARGLLHPALLITDRMPLSEVSAAFEKVDRETPETIKIVLDVRQA